MEYLVWRWISEFENAILIAIQNIMDLAPWSAYAAPKGLVIPSGEQAESGVDSGMFRFLATKCWCWQMDLVMLCM
jgi:hypothetical protein